jgi:hypothetical protein
LFRAQARWPSTASYPFRQTCLIIPFDHHRKTPSPVTQKVEKNRFDHPTNPSRAVHAGSMKIILDTRAKPKSLRASAILEN